MESSKPRQARLLFVDDDVKLQKLVGGFLKGAGLDVTVAGSVGAATATLAEKPFDVVVTDLKMPDGSGLDVLETVQRDHPDVPVLLVTAYATVETAVHAMKRGAFHFVVKPFLMDQLLGLVRKAVEIRDLQQENSLLRARMEEESPPSLVGDAPAIREVRERLGLASGATAPVLISGDVGTGKGVAARLIHDLGPRAARPFVRVNCAALPPDMLEAELFGYKKAGTKSTDPGRFRAAHGGTLFLDEVSALDDPVQAKLLRALRDGEVVPLHAEAAVKVDVRVVAATNQDLPALARVQQFREDLLARLGAFHIVMPTLRQRLDDLPELVDVLLQRISLRLGRPRPSVDVGQLRLLRQHPWPGNVRELENVLERAVLLSRRGRFKLDGLLSSPAESQLVGDTATTLGTAVKDLEKRMVLDALRRSRGFKKDAAAMLGLSQRALSYYLRKHDIRD